MEFAVEDVPVVPLGSDPALDDDVLVDDTAGGAVPLGRLLPAGVDGRGRPTAARVVVYRRPLEARAADRSDLADLVHDVVVDQVARLLNLDPDEVDPPRLTPAVALARGALEAAALALGQPAPDAEALVLSRGRTRGTRP